MPDDTSSQVRRSGAWLVGLVWAVGVLGGLGVLVIAMLFWQINCPGSAAVSPQRDVCDSVGPWGGTALMAVGLAMGASAAGLLLWWRAGHERRSPTPWLVIAALLLPMLVPFAVYRGLTLPGDYCSPEQEKAEAVAIEEWKATNKRQDRPDWCSAYEGDFS